MKSQSSSGHEKAVMPIGGERRSSRRRATGSRARLLWGGAGAVAALVLAAEVPPLQAADCPHLVISEWNAETVTGDPAVLLSLADVYHARSLFDPFIDMDSGMQPVSVLAESWESNADATEWTFHVRQGVKFHDGSPLTAEDVIYTYRRLLDPATASPAAGEMTGLKPENFSAPDAQTVKVTLESAQVELPLMLATKHGMIVKNGATTEELRFHPIGTGPFTLKELVPGALKQQFERNPNYWQEGLPKSECLVVSAVQEPVARAAAILSGDADLLMIVDPTTVPTLQEKPEITLVQAKGGTALTMGMFNDTPPFDNVKVRQAMKLVVDREAMLKTALLGFGITGNDNPILPNSPDAYRTDIIARDVEKAKQLLAEAGHPDGLSVDLYVGEVYPGIMPMVQAYQQMAAEAGIKVNLIVGPAGEFWDNVWMKYPFTVSTWGMRPTPLALAVAYRKAAKWNETHFYRDDFDALMDKAAVTLDADARRKVYQDAQRMISEEGGTIIPIFSATVAALRPGCTGYTPSADHNRPRLAEISCE